MGLKRFINGFSSAVVLFHIDTDGICSAKIAGEALNRLNIEVVEFIPTTPKSLDESEFVNKVLNTNAEAVVIVDVELSKNNLLYKKAKKKRFLVLDHHRIDELPTENTLYINPKIDGDERFTCASKICYDEFKKIVDIEDLDWVAAVGIIGDSAVKLHKRFLKRIFSKYNVDIGNDKEYFMDSYFGELAKMLNSGKIIKGQDGALIALRAIQESSTPDELYNKGYKLRQWSEEIDGYIEQMKGEFEAKKEEYPNLELVFFVFKPKYTIGSVLSTILSFENPHKTIVIISIKGRSYATVNFRRHDGTLDMGMLAKMATKGLKRAGGGGHVPAAGGHILVKDINLFKRNVVSTLKKMIKDKAL